MVVIYEYGFDVQEIDTALRNYLGAKYAGLICSGFRITVILTEDLTAQEKTKIKQHIEDFSYRKLTKRVE